MLEKLSEQYSGPNLISEKMKHLGSFLETMLNKEGITILHLVRHDFLVKPSEFDYLFSLFDLWNKHAITLPGFYPTGSSGCGITSLTYYPENSKKELFSIRGHKQVLEYLNTDDYLKFRKINDDAGNEIDLRLEKELNNNCGLKGQIRRFHLYISRDLDDERQLVSLYGHQMEGFREMVDYYSPRKQNYK